MPTIIQLFIISLVSYAQNPFNSTTATTWNETNIVRRFLFRLKKWFNFFFLKKKWFVLVLKFCIIFGHLDFKTKSFNSEKKGI